MSLNAVYPMAPCCPKCLQLLERPSWFMDLVVEDRLNMLTVACPTCKIVIRAWFYEYRGDLISDDTLHRIGVMTDDEYHNKVSRRCRDEQEQREVIERRELTRLLAKYQLKDPACL